MEKHKPRNIFNNLRFLITNTLKWDKKVLLFFILFTVVTVTSPFIDIFIPKILIDELMGQNRVKFLIAILISYLFISAILNYLSSYLEGAHGPRFMHIAYKFGNLIKIKSMKMDYKYT